MQTHLLKIDTQPLLDLLEGVKNCEFRRDDRGFAVGDLVSLKENTPPSMRPLARTTQRYITHIQRGYGIPEGFCVLSYRPVHKDDGPTVPKHKFDCLVDHARRQDQRLVDMGNELNTVRYYQGGENVWYWQEDGGNHLASLCNEVPVVIAAAKLRAIVGPYFGDKE